MPRERNNTRSSRRPAAMRALTVVLGLLAVVLLVALIAAWALFVKPATNVAAGSPVQLAIPQGASTARIGEILAEAGVVRNANMFRVRSRLADADGALRAGVYDMRTGMDYDEALALLKTGPPIAYSTVTIPEGFVVEQIAERFERDAGIPASEFLPLAKTGAATFAAEHPYLEKAYRGSLEGYLFPKTYRVKEGSTAEDAIEMMLDQFDIEVAQVDMTRANQSGMSTQELVVMASIIERETKLATERPLVSSVIYNRLRKGMRLEIDATIEYVLPGNRFRLRNRDLRIDSPYNTYRNKGLPPGPISSPGLASLQAAANPADTPYIYYVLTGKDGSHTFAADSKTFLAAKRKSKEVFGK